MKVLEELYENFIGDKKSFANSEELSEIMLKINSMLCNKASLEEKDMSALYEMIIQAQSISQKQNFVNGFRYAVQILKECF